MHTRTDTRTDIQICIKKSKNNPKNNHEGILILQILGGDIELNPGPLSHDIIVMTQNCRGLNDRGKLRQILTNKNVKVKNKLFTWHRSLESEYL